MSNSNQFALSESRCDGCGEYKDRCLCDGYEGLGSDDESGDVTPGLANPSFSVRFEIAEFNFGCEQGLQVKVNGKRRAIKINHNSTPQQVANGLRFLADWTEEQGQGQ